VCFGMRASCLEHTLCMCCCCCLLSAAHRFGPSDLLGDAHGARVPLLLEQQQNFLAWTSNSSETLQQRAGDAVFQAAAAAALAAAHKVGVGLLYSCVLARATCLWLSNRRTTCALCKRACCILQGLRNACHTCAVAHALHEPSWLRRDVQALS
jgi:hypothetical protein